MSLQRVVKDPKRRIVSELESRGAMKSAQQLKTAATSRRSLPQPRRISNRTLPDILVVIQRQVLAIQKAQRTVDVPLLQYIDTTVDVPVVKQRREDTTGLHDEVQRHPDGQKMRSTYLRTENKKQTVFQQ